MGLEDAQDLLAGSGRRWRGEQPRLSRHATHPQTLPLHIGKYQVQAELGRTPAEGGLRAVDAFKTARWHQAVATCCANPSRLTLPQALRNEIDAFTARLHTYNIDAPAEMPG